jgi:uncharacterized membrane protein
MIARLEIAAAATYIRMIARALGVTAAVAVVALFWGAVLYATFGWFE